ncbi:odorant receptor 13a-like [Pseudomyrmex gracilis]|uniref:odorant receptor 13a-like n=1 Tax=Pseudomyrmex gracilis TaxID=219809 RepID=UPI000995639D|nr:odorant receptor 13a-like [Pseudomyrmex gracilis]
MNAHTILRTDVIVGKIKYAALAYQYCSTNKIVNTLHVIGTSSCLVEKVFLVPGTTCLRTVCCKHPDTLEAERIMKTTEFARASNIVIWNRWFLRLLGLWPIRVNQPVFVFFVIYSISIWIMEMCYLFECDTLECVVTNLSENILFLILTGKIVVMRLGCDIMSKFLKIIESDLTTEAYHNVQEKTVYLRYNEIGLKFIKISMGNTMVAAIIYYLRTFLENWNAMTSGSNFSYELPYRVIPFIEINDMFTYTCFCIYLMIALLTITCGYSGPDTFVISMTLHICGQLAALSCRIDSLLKNHDNYRYHLSIIVHRHLQLITLAEQLENTFNLIFFAQSLGSTVLLCLTLYMAVNPASSEDKEVSTVISYTLYIFCLLITIWSYCYTGECLITESTGVRDAFYKSDWYNHSPMQSRLIRTCMIRAEKPAILTMGKFCVLSLNTFTNLIKTSMAYLSMLRNFS